MKELKTKQKYTTTFLERGSFWFFGIGMLFYYQIVGSYLNTYLLLRGVDLGKVALIFLGIKIWDAVNDPLFAFIFDRVKFKKEKCLPWLRIAAIIMPLASIAVFNMPANWSETGKLIWFAVTYMLWDAAYTVCDVPFFSMTTTMTVNMDERNTLFSVARVFHGAGTLLCTTAMTWLVGENVGMNFGLASIIVCGIGALFTIPLCFLGKERYAIPPKQEDQEAHKFSLKEMFSYLKQNKYLTMMYGCQILCGICHEMLAALISKFSGLTFGEYLQRHIFTPLGMTNTAFTLDKLENKVLANQYRYEGKDKPLTPLGAANCLIPPILKESASGGLISSVDDYMKFQEALTVDGQLLHRNTVQLMRLDQLSGSQRDGYGYTHIGMGYGLGVRTIIDQAKCGSPVGFGPFGWGGATGSYGSIDPENELTFFYMQHVFDTDCLWGNNGIRNIIYSSL